MGFRVTPKLKWQISHLAWLDVVSYFSRQCWWIRPNEPEQLHGEIKAAKPVRSPSWQMRQKTEEEFALDATEVTVAAEGEATLGDGVMGSSSRPESALESEDVEPEE